MGSLYIECNMGAAGDMLMAALLELVDDRAGFLERLNNAGIDGVTVSSEPSKKCGITGTGITVKVDGREECADGHHHDNHHGHHHEPDREHHHSGYHDIEHIIGHLKVSGNVKKNALDVYKLIAEAESRSHGVPVRQIHFHEVGEKDAIADIVGVCMLIEELAPDAILASPVNTGSGQVSCAHGILPVPAPATAHILRDVPIYNDGAIKTELCTPTGAALLKHFVGKFTNMPVMAVCKTGYGMGKKDFPQINCVRAYLGDISGDNCMDEMAELTCNLDDMTPESLAFAQETLLREGALDVWVTSIGMKKGRMGAMLSCLCGNAVKDRMVSLIFKHTTTLGIRETICRRYTLQRESTEIQTKYGPVRVKSAEGYGAKKSKPEYGDIAKIAQENNLPIDAVLRQYPPA
ncbi:MAG: nickel pincer cofactor biosynthesis protein LarC [Chitinispirillia bacterium]|nr:nickel pincer cofactor biosynthesis protein LarC [Chitinispirillia bacterium]MCL2241170.1 nickel pincer cofactor biosynthesis protein LarC [Chitinispirillia bacterium]